jgi:hypothetical protein
MPCGQLNLTWLAVMPPAGLLGAPDTSDVLVQQIITAVNTGDVSALLQAMTQEESDEDDFQDLIHALGSAYCQDPGTTTTTLAAALQLGNRDDNNAEALAQASVAALRIGGIEGESPLLWIGREDSINKIRMPAKVLPSGRSEWGGTGAHWFCIPDPAGDAAKAFSAAYVAARASNSSSLLNIVHYLGPGARPVFSLP